VGCSTSTCSSASCSRAWPRLARSSPPTSRGHGHTNDIDRPLTCANLASDVVGLLAGVNLFIAVFNFLPILPLDGGHIAGALYEALRRGWARLLGRPDPGYFDVGRLLPVAYAFGLLLFVMGVLLVWTDIVNPVRLE